MVQSRPYVVASEVAVELVHCVLSMLVNQYGFSVVLEDWNSA